MQDNKQYVCHQCQYKLRAGQSRFKCLQCHQTLCHLCQLRTEHAQHEREERRILSGPFRTYESRLPPPVDAQTKMMHHQSGRYRRDVDSDDSDDDYDNDDGKTARNACNTQ